MIWVIDSCDTDHIKDSVMCLEKIVESRELRFGVPILICANKQDDPEALSVQDIASRFELNSLGHPYKVIGTVATTGKGLDEGIFFFELFLFLITNVDSNGMA